MLQHEIVPAAKAGAKRLMVMLPGLGDSIEGIRWWPEAMETPWLNYALVNAPDEYYGGFSWYDFAGDMIPGVTRSRRMLFELLDHFQAQGYSHEHITLGGFSQGCLMSIEVALRYPHRLAGVVGMSGYVCAIDDLLQRLPPIAKQQRLLLTHGAFDTLVPLVRTQEQINRLQAEGLNVEWQAFAKAHTYGAEDEFQVIRKFVRAGYPDATGR